MLFFFFFSSRRRHTRWTGDWSSDVCSSDLFDTSQQYADVLGDRASGYSYSRIDNPTVDAFALGFASLEAHGLDQIGRASCKGKSVELGGRGIMKKKSKDEMDR